MHIRCLGPVEVVIEGSMVDLGGAQQRHVFGVLVSRIGSPTSTDALIDELWPDIPPNTARKTVQGYVSAIRRSLPEGSITLDASGYTLNADESDIDVYQFEHAVRGARDRLSHDPESVRAGMRDALGLWRGDPYGGVSGGDLLRPVVSRLNDLYEIAREVAAEADIYTGHEAEAVVDLSQLVDRFPLRERLHTLLVLALYRTGRQSEALRAFANARAVLAREVGLEPSAELRMLEQRVIDHDPVLLGPNPLTFESHSPPPGRARNPYKGLRAFEGEDAADFFGRSALTRVLVDRVLSRDSGQLLVLAGPSGSGKSSVVRAGLVPELARRGLTIDIVFPARGTSFDEDANVVVVDQLEEIYSLDEVTAAAYLDSLLDLAEADDGPMVVATLRSDVVDAVLRHPRFAKALQRALVFITPLADHELREAVAAPAESVGKSVAPDLVASVVEQLSGGAGSLPLLQFALTDLFDRTAGPELTLDGLSAAGGIGGALSRRADEAIAPLGSTGTRAARDVMLRLVAIGDDGSLFRRRARLDDIESIDGAARVVESLSAARILTTDRDQNGIRTVEVAHESILTEWGRMSGWIDDARDGLRRHRVLSVAYEQWEHADRADDLLLGSDQIARLAPNDDDSIALSRAETEFIAASKAAAMEAASRRRRRRFVVTSAFGVIALIASSAALFAFGSRNDARTSAAESQSRALASAASAALEEDPQLAILLAVQAMIDSPSRLSTIEDRLTLRTAMGADRLKATLAVSDTAEFVSGLDLAPDGKSLAISMMGQLQLRDTASWDVIWTLDDPAIVEGVAFSPDGSLVVVGSQVSAVPPHVTVVDARTGTVVEVIEFPESECVAGIGPQSYSHDAGLIAVLIWNDCVDQGSASLRVLRAGSGEEVYREPGAWIAQFAEEAPRLVLFEIGQQARRTRVYDVPGFELVEEVEGHAGDISPAGDLLATMISGFAPSLRDLNASVTFDRLGGLDYLPAPAGTDFIVLNGVEGGGGPPDLGLVVGTQGQTTTIWSIQTGNVAFTLPTGAVASVAFDPSSTTLYTGSPNGVVDVWDLSSSGLQGGQRQSFPYWFDANAMKTNPLSDIGTMYHESLATGLGYYATFDVATGQLLETEVADVLNVRVVDVYPLPGGRVLYAATSPDEGTGGPFVVASANGDVEPLVGCATPVADWETGFAEGVCVDGGSAFITVSSPVVSSDGTEIAVGRVDGSLHMWDATTLEKTTTESLLSALDPEVLSRFIDVPQDVDDVATRLGTFGSVRLVTEDWLMVQVKDNGPIAVLSRPGFETIAASEVRPIVWSFELAHDESFVVFATEEGIHRLDTDDWSETLIVPTDERVRGIAVSPDNTLVMLGGTDGFVHIHNVQTGELVDQIAEEWVSDGHWIDESRIVVGTGLTGVWTVLDLDIHRVALAALGQLTRGFTTGECLRFGIDPCPTLDDMRSAIGVP